jgi:hypothetical protein
MDKFLNDRVQKICAFKADGNSLIDGIHPVGFELAKPLQDRCGVTYVFNFSKPL